MSETLHHAQRAMIQFSVIFWGDTPSPNKQTNKKSFLNTIVAETINNYQ
jgi:hypothetical protein